MASVPQPGAAGIHLPGSNLPLTPENIQKAFQKFQQMREAGVSDKDPEYVRLSSFLGQFQQHRKMQQQKALYAASQQQQQQANSTATANNAKLHQTAPSSDTTAQTQASSALAPSAMAASSGTPSSSAKAAAPPLRSTAANGAYFSQEQLSTLKSQIFAFKCLSKQMGIPAHVQQQLFLSQQKASTPIVTTGSAINPSEEGHFNGASTATPTKGPEGPKRHDYSSFQEPEALLSEKISYSLHKLRENRPLIPSVFPSGVDVLALRQERENIVFNRMKTRLDELRSIPVNIAHWDTRVEKMSPEDSVKRKAVIEMKMLSLYQKQRLLREKVGRQMIQYDNLAMTANRSNYRRMKKQSLREARITEKLEKQQRDARETREKKKHNDYLQTVLTHAREVATAAHNQRNKMQKLGRLMMQQHQVIEKDEQKRIERTAKQRLQALKSNDEEAYLKLLDQAKDTRITHLLRQTDGFLGQLAASVKAQQRKAAEHYGGDAGEFNDEVESDDEAEEQDARKIDYYAVAHKITETITVQPTILVGGTLKEYQIKGLQWMISLYNNNLNGILADEMGLGKTIQTISLITYLIERKKQNGPFLVIVPLSTLTNWTLEFEKWAPSIAKIVYKGPPNTRKNQQQQIRYGNFQVLLTTYEYIIKDRPVLSKIKWIHMIIDEGHRMKNSQSKLSATLTQYYSTRYRLILTGTPLQNNLPELWALLNFVLPTIFKSVTSFDEWFNTPFANTGGQDKMELTEEEQILVIRRLHKVLRPFLLRRLKKDVEKDLPDKTEKILKVKFSALQTRLYKQMVTHNKIAVSDGKGGGKSNQKGLSNMIMQLRKLCNHPFVFDTVEDEMNPLNISNDILWRVSGKFELLDRILPKYQATGHRVLMFFQMTAIMDIMEDFLRYRGIMFLRLDGTTKSDDRSELLRLFNAPDSPYFMFLLSTRAGGLGLNLQTADTVIIYDSDWNPHQDLQAQDRAHRIGQKNEVRILRLISSNSVEEKILERAKFKLDMDGKVIQAGRFDNKSSENERDTMLRVMLETAEAAETLEKDQEDMDDEELNEILARSDKELEDFKKMDEERSREAPYGYRTSQPKPRLMADEELPDIYKEENAPIVMEKVEASGRGARVRANVAYDDILDEEQWLAAVEDENDSPEQAAQRVLDRRARKQAKVQADGDSPGSSAAQTRESTEEVEAPKKGRGRKNAKVDKRKAEDNNDEPAPKRSRGSRPSVKSSGDSLSPKYRGVLQTSLQNLYSAIYDIEVEDSGSEEDEEPPRLIIGPFVDLPKKRDYPEYFQIIQNPICMKMIDKKIKKKEYSSLMDMKADVDLLCTNAKTYNDDGSVLFVDAILIQNTFESRMKDVINEHPELGAEESSTGPGTSAGTPIPSNGGPKMKLKITNDNYQNGGSSGVQSDDE